MKTLITGGAGFIGSHLCGELLARGHSVRVLDDLSTGYKGNLDHARNHPAYQGLVEGSIAEEQALRAGLAGADTVYHVAGQAKLPQALQSPTDTFANEVAAPFRLLEEVRHRRLRLILVSSCAVYGSALQDGSLSEHSRLHVASPHAACKLALESLVLAYARSYRLDATVIRPFNVYGPGQRADASGGVVAIFCQRALTGQPLLIHGSGGQSRDLLYVDDCVRLLSLAGETGAACGEVLNAGTGLSVSINDLAGRIQTAPFARPGVTLKHVDHPYPQCEIHRLRCDATFAQRLLGWRPLVSLDEGIARTAAWLQNR